MTKKYPTDVDGHLNKMNHPLRKEIDLARDIIRSASSEIKERVKWNAPSYYIKAGDKECDMGSFNLHQEQFLQFILVYYTGLPKDDHGILTGTWKDRREIRFTDLEDINSKKSALQAVVKDWVELTNR